MKTNAIIRIILFSIGIIVLLGMLGVGLGATIYTAKSVEEMDPIEVHQTPDQTTSETTLYTADPLLIQNIEIDWAAGSITILPSADISEIRISESQPKDNQYKMVCRQSGNSLSIQFCKDSVHFPSFGINGNLNKDLLILVPTDWICQGLEIDAASADVKLSDLTIHKLDFDSASGECEMVNCNVGNLELDAASGDVSFTGCLDVLDFSGASADCTMVLTNCPRSIDLDGVSGKLDLTLPSDCGFTLNTGGISCDFTTDFETTKHNGTHYHGDGSCRIEVEALSGRVCIRDGGYKHHSTEADCPDTDNCDIHSNHHSSHH